MYKTPETNVVLFQNYLLQAASPAGGMNINHDPSNGTGDAPQRRSNPLNGQISLN